MRYRFTFLTIFLTVFTTVSAFAQPGRAITVITEPNATVWVDDIRRGVTNENGKLVVKPLTAGARRIRVRASGYKEFSLALLPAQRGDVKVALTKTTDEAELAFQQ